MPRKTRIQMVGKQEDAERQEREDALLALEHELHQLGPGNVNDPLSANIEPVGITVSLLQAIRMPLTVHA